MSAFWRRLYPKAAGSLPGGMVTQWGVGITVLLVLVLLTAWIYLSGGSDAEVAPGTVQDRSPPLSFTDRMSAQIEDAELRAEARRQAADRALRQQQQTEPGRGGNETGRVSGDEARLRAGVSEDTGEPYTEEEWELRERLRLEALERHSRSLRSSPVAQTYRQADGRAADAGAQEAAKESPTAEDPGAEALNRVLDTIQATTAGLADEAEAEAETDRALLEALSGTASVTTPEMAPLAVAGRDYTSPPRLGPPEDPPGWERIYEGSFLEAALVTQLSGDFPGPVLAVVSVPFYSADRQRILVPRGARVIGTAQAVAQQDQSRLAVSFHRLILPDGRFVSLGFHGLNQLGEGALKDRVNRHYLNMFTAVGAVGILSGLTLRGSNPYGGGQQSFQAGAGQGLGQSATQILQRFLNRLPTLTIRAGHRLRIWFTSDVLVPQPTQGE